MIGTRQTMNGMQQFQARDPLRSREETARVEVGHTNVTPRVAEALVVCFLVLVAALPVVDLAGAPASAQPGAWSHLVAEGPADAPRVTGEPAAARFSFFWDHLVPANRAVLTRISRFESALEDESPVGRLLRPPAQAVLSGGLGAGNERVYVGRDGWLYYRPDVEYVTGRGFLDPAGMRRRVAASSEFETPPAPDPRPAIRRFAGDLSARGVVLIVMPTPVKPTVHPERLTRRAAGVDTPVQNGSYTAFVEELQSVGILVFDPAPRLLEGARDTGEPQYLSTDTHWRPEAMQREARRLAAFIRDRVALPPQPSPGYTTEPREARQAGDTVLMLDLPGSQRLYPPETVALDFVVDAEGHPWRPTPGADVLVLGDSFSNIYSLPGMGWGEAAGFVEQLSVALVRPVDRLVQNDQGARATRDLLVRELRANPGRLSGVRVLVWQFATRELGFGDWAVLPLP
jgi:hypothetical protein